MKKLKILALSSMLAITSLTFVACGESDNKFTEVNIDGTYQEISAENLEQVQTDITTKTTSLLSQDFTFDIYAKINPNQLAQIPGMTDDSNVGDSKNIEVKGRFSMSKEETKDAQILVEGENFFLFSNDGENIYVSVDESSYKYNLENLQQLLPMFSHSLTTQMGSKFEDTQSAWMQDFTFEQSVNGNTTKYKLSSEMESENACIYIVTQNNIITGARVIVENTEETFVDISMNLSFEYNKVSTEKYLSKFEELENFGDLDLPDYGDYANPDFGGYAPDFDGNMNPNFEDFADLMK